MARRQSPGGPPKTCYNSSFVNPLLLKKARHSRRNLAQSNESVAVPSKGGARPWLRRGPSTQLLLALLSLLVVNAGAGDSEEVSRFDVGGHEGTASSGGTYATGAGGEGSRGAPIQIGGQDAPTLCQSEETFDVLFVGNSYTHYFEMPQLLAGMAESAGCSLNAQLVAPGGSSLAAHAKSAETLSAIGAQDWDAVVLQNFSQLPSQPVEDVRSKSFPHVRTLVDAIVDNDPNTSLYFYVTWGRRDGDSEYCKTQNLVCSFEGHTAALQRGYSLYADEFQGTLVNVGATWSQVKRSRGAPFSHRDLYGSDGSHPSLIGSYLAASVFFASFFKASPEGLSYPQGLSEASARYIQRLAGNRPLSGV